MFERVFCVILCWEGECSVRVSVDATYFHYQFELLLITQRKNLKLSSISPWIFLSAESKTFDRWDESHVIYQIVSLKYVRYSVWIFCNVHFSFITVYYISTNKYFSLIVVKENKLIIFSIFYKIFKTIINK